MSEKKPLVEIEHLAKAYHRGGQTVPVLTDITLTINEGDFITIIWPFGLREVDFA